MIEVKNRVRDYILANFLPGESPSNVRDDTRLLTSGILDSLAALQLMAFIEQEFGVELLAADRIADNLDRLTDIDRLVQAKRAS